IDRRFPNPFELELRVQLAALSFEHFRCGAIRSVEQSLHRLLDLLTANDDEGPRLHETDRSCMVRCIEELVEHDVRNGRRKKAIPHIAALVDRLVEARLFGFGKFTGGPWLVCFVRHERTMAPVKYTPISAS